jgi:hypothetical protein
VAVTPNTEAALWSFGVMVLGGMSLGAWATLYGSFRSAIRLDSASGTAADVLWFFPAVGLFLAALAVAAWGELRVWAVVAAAVGFLLWWGLAHPLVGWLTAVVCRAMSRALRWATRPFRRAGHRVGRGLGAALKPAWALMKRLVRIDSR